MKRILFTLILCTFYFFSPAQQTRTAAEQALDNEIEALKEYAGLKHGAWAVYVQNITTGNVEAEYNSEMSLMPASIQSIFGVHTNQDQIRHDVRWDGSFDRSDLGHGWFRPYNTPYVAKASVAFIPPLIASLTLFSSCTFAHASASTSASTC